VLFDWEGRVIHYVPRLRIKTLGGESIQGVTITTDGWRTWLEDVLDKLGSMGACGVITVQVFLTEQGPVLLEINPRFGGGFPLSLKAGALYPSWLLKLAAGEDVATRLGDYRIGVRMARFMEECYTEK